MPIRPRVFLVPPPPDQRFDEFGIATYTLLSDTSEAREAREDAVKAMLRHAHAAAVTHLGPDAAEKFWRQLCVKKRGAKTKKQRSLHAGDELSKPVMRDAYLLTLYDRGLAHFGTKKNLIPKIYKRILEFEKEDSSFDWRLLAGSGRDKAQRRRSFCEYLRLLVKKRDAQSAQIAAREAAYAQAWSILGQSVSLGSTVPHSAAQPMENLQN